MWTNKEPNKCFFRRNHSTRLSKTSDGCYSALFSRYVGGPNQPSVYVTKSFVLTHLNIIAVHSSPPVHRVGRDNVVISSERHVHVPCVVSPARDQQVPQSREHVLSIFVSSFD